MNKQELIEMLRLEIKKPSNQHTRSFPLWITKQQATDLLRELEGDQTGKDDSNKYKCSCPDQKCLLGDHPTCRWKDFTPQPPKTEKE